MSIKQMTLVFNDESIKGNEKLLMLAIADSANDSGVCFPSWNALMKKTSMSKNSLAKWLGVLEEKQYLFRKQRSRKNGSKTSNKFLIYPHHNKDFLDFEDMEMFEDLFTKAPKGELPKDETQSTKSMTTKVPKGELGEGGKVPKGELLEPSLIINHQINHHLPDWLDKNAWKKWVLYRSEIKRKLTSTMIKEQISFLSNHIDSHVLIINTSIMNGWQGLFEPKQQSQPKSFKQQDKEAIDNSIDNYYRMKEQGFSLQDELIKQAERENQNKGRHNELN